MAIEYGNSHYLVTAKHVVSIGSNQVLPGETIRIYGDDGRLSLVAVKHIAFSHGDPNKGDSDVAVLQPTLPFNFGATSPAIARPDEIWVPRNVAMLSSEHYTAFNPTFGITTRVGNVAKIVTPQMRGPFTGDFMMHTIAYPGFSGSPIITWSECGSPTLAGIAARYSYRAVPQFGIERAHTGFIGCFHVQHAIDLITVLQQGKCLPES